MHKRLYPYIPNALTLMAMCLGLTALRLSYVREDIYTSLMLLLMAAFLDGIDGKIARRLKVESPVGAQLDSLADFLNFCVTPTLIIFEWHLKDFYFFGWAATLIFLVGGAYRLARFNVMYSKGVENISSNYFVGVPTPAGAILIFLPMVLELKGYMEASSIFTALYVTFVAFLMISHIKTPSNRLLNVKKRHLPLALVVTSTLVAGFIYAPLDMYLLLIAAYSLVTLFLFFNDSAYRQRKLEKKDR
jgi:CDP-diacylglycerol---serine O-phosphatidyltransferase